MATKGLVLSALKTELLTDPNAYGYAAMIAAGQLQDIANVLNLARETISVPRPDVPPMEVLEAIKVTDFIDAPNLLYGSWFESITQAPTLRVLKENGTDTRLMTNLMTLLKNGSLSETRVRALARRTGSRGEQLFGPGTSIRWEDVHAALNTN